MRALGAVLLQEALHHAVFDRMEGDDRQISAGFQRPFSCHEPLPERLVFGIDRNAQRLKAAGRWVRLTRLGPRQTTAMLFASLLKRGGKVWLAEIEDWVRDRLSGKGE